MDLEQCILLSGQFLITVNLFFFLLGVFITYLLMNHKNKRLNKERALFEFQKGWLEGFRRAKKTALDAIKKEQ
tara:strand:- start:326 stop:544 length:219 start_codon:yes stop_codon:yes gene_type:complete